MSQADLAESRGAGGAAGSRPSLVARALVLAAILALLGFVVFEGGMLLAEWVELRQELSRARVTAVIGYPGIQPLFSYADRPDQWYRAEGDRLRIWAGWRDGVGHSWFEVARADIDPDRMSPPVGSETYRAIDAPLVEVGGGTIWGRVPDDAPVVGGRLAGVDTAYPILVLKKVGVVNDTIADQPFLVTYNPYAPLPTPVEVFEPVLNGQRITLAYAGWLLDRRPIYYDRGTQSLWVAETAGLRAISGRRKGATLARVAQPAALMWSEWRSQHPRSRLVVGADRSARLPEL